MTEASPAPTDGPEPGPEHPGPVHEATPGASGEGEAEHRAKGDPTREPGRVLSRADEGRMLGGVCSGLGRYAGVDPVLLRVGFGVLVFGSGIGIILYIAAFLLMREPDGSPGYVEQWTSRIFDTETVLALLGAVFAFGLMINIASAGISTRTVAVGVLLVITFLAAHARGVDLLAIAKSLPERIGGRRGVTRAPEDAFARPRPFGPPPGWHDMPGEETAAGHTGPYTQPGEYRRLSDLAREARSAPAGRPADYSSGEPFAPYGPYNTGAYGQRGARGTRWPGRGSHQGGYYGPEPHQTAGPSPSHIRWNRKNRKKRPKSFIGGLTMCLALIVGGIMVSVQQSSTGSINLPVVGGAVLVTIGAGLLVAAWFGRGAGLVAAGTFTALLLITASTINEIPTIGNYTWRPVKAAKAGNDYTVGIGVGNLDLSDIKLTPGARARFSASVSMGQLEVTVPSTARVEVHGHARLGELKMGNTVENGPNVTVDHTFEPEGLGTDDAATIELHVRVGFGDVEVRRAS